MEVMGFGAISCMAWVVFGMCLTNLGWVNEYNYVGIELEFWKFE